MITHPSASELIDEVRSQLRLAVTPAITDEQLRGLLGMLDALLARAAVRAEHEIGWMLEEIAAIEVMVDGVGADDPRVSEARSALEAGRRGSDDAAAVAAEYRLASEVLCRGLESGREIAAASRAILDTRLAREAQVLGDFTLVARD